MLGIGLRRAQDADSRAAMEADGSSMQQIAAENSSAVEKKGRIRIKRSVGEDATREGAIRGSEKPT
jgi:hypothetical protein